MSHTWSWQVLRCGTFRLDGGSMFGVIPKPMWSRLTEPDQRNRILLQTNCLLLDDGEKKVLIETGCGEKWTDKDRDIFDMERRSIRDALREIDVNPADIDAVTVSHLHFDHAGGFTHWDDAHQPVSTFPNATIFLQRREWEDALAGKSTMTKTYLREHLDPIAEQVELMDGETSILPGCTAWPVPGHTWGHQAIRFTDKHSIVCFAGDLVPTINHAGIPFNMGYDMLPYVNSQSKRDLFTRAAAEGWRFVIDHEPGPPVVTVQADTAGRFTLTPIPSTP